VVATLLLVPDMIEELLWVRDTCSSGRARNLRLDGGLSCAEVARPLGVDQATVWRWEEGLRKPRGELALRYAALLRTLDRPRGDRCGAA